MYKIAIIGQGYVGLPLALEFSKHFPVYGFDINVDRVNELNKGEDHTLEADLDLLQNALKSTKETAFATGYKATASLEEIKDSRIELMPAVPKKISTNTGIPIALPNAATPTPAPPTTVAAANVTGIAIFKDNGISAFL